MLKIAVVHGSDNHLFDLLHNICWAANSEGASVEYMGVDHGGAHILVARSSWIVRMSWPRSSRCVANEWRNV